MISLGMSYAPETDPLALAGQPDRGRISVYAQGADYHDVVKRALKKVAGWLAAEAGAGVKVFVDTAPVMEKPLAEAAGLGRASTPIWSAAPMAAGCSSARSTPPSRWSRTRRMPCAAAAAAPASPPARQTPSRAPFQLDARRCISYLTIEHKGPIPEEFRAAMGNRIYGCDDCLAVCPWNRFADAARANKAFLPRAELVAPASPTCWR